MQYTLRPYQEEAVKKLMWAQQFPEADVCVLPTGAGKSLVIAELTHRLRQDVLILQPTKEILEQNLEKMLNYIDRDEVGIYSASMNEKTVRAITFATIQSIYKKPEEFTHFGQVIIDECHLVNPKNLDGMFTTFLQAIGSPKVVGFTATPYRQDMMYERTEDGSLYAHTTTKLINRIKQRFWHRIVFNINNADLVQAGFLVPLKYIDKSVIQHKDIPTNISKSDFDLDAFERKIADKQDEILEAVYFGQELGKSVLVFCSSVHQASQLCDLVPNSAVVTSKTKAKDRARIIKEFRSGVIQTVFNVGVLTVGFDHPTLDCIVLLRPTRSIGLYYQMLGRGVRKADGKTHCKVIDMTGTVKALGRIESIKMVKREKWELESEMGTWHNTPMYSFKITSET